MLVSLSSLGGAGWQFFDNNGVPLAGGKLYSYASGTTTPQQTYTSYSGDQYHTNPIILDAAGRVSNGNEIWLASNLSYKFILKTSTDTQLWSVDNIIGITNEQLVEDFNGNGILITFALSNTPVDENSTQVFINGVYQQKNSYSVVGNTLVFSEPPPDTSTIEVVYN